MIAQLQGVILSKAAGELVLDVHGVAFLLSIPLSTSESLGLPGERTTVLTHLHVREDALQLFGFASEAERALFKSLLSVTGIGPKMALVILSGIGPQELREAIGTGNVAALTAVSGVGRKTAERIVLELRSSVGELLSAASPAALSTPSSGQMKTRSEAAVALMSLGYTRQAADQAIRAVAGVVAGNELTVEELVRRALQHAAKQR